MKCLFVLILMVWGCSHDNVIGTEQNLSKSYSSENIETIDMEVDIFWRRVFEPQQFLIYADYDLDGEFSYQPLDETSFRGDHKEIYTLGASISKKEIIADFVELKIVSYRKIPVPPFDEFTPIVKIRIGIKE